MTRDAALLALRDLAPSFATKVAPIYRLLDWDWWGQGAPSEATILEQLLHFAASIEELVSSDPDGVRFMHATGGLGAYVETEGGAEDWRASFEFSLEETIYG